MLFYLYVEFVPILRCLTPIEPMGEHCNESYEFQHVEFNGRSANSIQVALRKLRANQSRGDVTIRSSNMLYGTWRAIFSQLPRTSGFSVGCG